MVDEHRGHRGARLQRFPELLDLLARDITRIGERVLSRPASSCRIESEVEQRPNDAAGVALQADRGQLAGLGVPLDEGDVEDAQPASALDPLQRADQPPLEAGAGRIGTRGCVGGSVTRPVTDGSLTAPPPPRLTRMR